MTFRLFVLTLGFAQLTSFTSSAHSVSSNRGSMLCTIRPGRAVALLQVERDMLLPFAPAKSEWMSRSGVRPGADSLLATPSTLMPAALVRLLNVDSATRAELVANGVTDKQPLVYIRAAPFRADCQVVRWTDSVPFAVKGEKGYVRGSIVPREGWIDGKPVLVIPETWNYPYPRRRGLAFRIPDATPLPSPELMFGINSVLEMPDPEGREMRSRQDSIKRHRALAWAKENPAAAETEPVQSIVRNAVLMPDWEVASRMPSRLRGTYRVDIEAEDKRGSFFFRTHDRPGYVSRGPTSDQTTAALLASPHVFGYSLVGLASTSRDSIPSESPRGLSRSLVWLATNDRPTLKDNESRRVLTGYLEFNLSGSPEMLWDELEPFVPPVSSADSALRAQINLKIPRSGLQPRLPITLKLDGRGGVRGDTVLTAGKRSIRISVARMDTLSVKRPF